MVNLTQRDRDAIHETAARLGIKPTDLTQAILYETIGTMNPDIRGGAGNAYRGLIQFGAREQKQYGYRPGMSIAEQVKGPVYNYLRDRGVKPGMKFIDIYSTINAGSPGHYGRRDASGKTVRQHVAEAEASYGKMARALLAGGPVPPMDIPNPTSTTLRKGMSGPAVRELQSQLAAAGLYRGKIDGDYGPQTQKAVRAAEMQYGLNVDRGIAGPQVQTALRNQGSVDNIASVLGFGSPNDTTTQPMSPTDIAFGRPVDLGEPSARFGIGDGASPGFPSVWGEQPAPGGFGPLPPSTFPARPERQFSNLAPARYDMPNSGVARGAPSPAPPMSFAANDIPLPRPRPSTVTMTGSASGGLGRDVAMGAGSTGLDKWQPLSLAPPPPENDPNIHLTGSAEGGLGRSVNMGAGYDTPGASWASMKGPAAGTDVLSGMKTSTPFEAPGTSINDVIKGVGGIPDALGWQTVKGWFGGEEPVAAKPSLMETMPPAVPPGGFPGGDTSIDQGWSAGDLKGGGGADRFDVAFGPAGGESALNKGIDGVSFLPPGGISPAPGGFGAPPAAMPTPPPITSAPRGSKISQLLNDGLKAIGFNPGGAPSYGNQGMGAGLSAGGYSPNFSPVSPNVRSAITSVFGPGYGSSFTPGANFFGAGSPAYTAPNFSPGSGGSTFAYHADGMGGGTYVDSHGNVHTY